MSKLPANQGMVDAITGLYNRQNGEVASLLARIAELEALVRAVTPDEMGGEPDLFWPDGGWEAWEVRARAALGTERGEAR